MRDDVVKPAFFDPVAGVCKLFEVGFAAIGQGTVFCRRVIQPDAERADAELNLSAFGGVVFADQRGNGGYQLIDIGSAPVLNCKFGISVIGAVGCGVEIADPLIRVEVVIEMMAFTL